MSRESVKGLVRMLPGGRFRFLNSRGFVASYLLFATLTVGAGNAQPDSVIHTATEAYLAGRIIEASRVFRTVHPDSMNERAAYYSGSALASAGDYPASIRYLRRAHELQPGNVGYIQQLARAYGQTGNTSESETAYRQILTIDSTYIPAIIALGLGSMERRDYEAASAFFASAIRQNALDFLSNYYYGLSLTNRGMPDSASSFLGVSLSLNRRYVPTIALLASVYYRRKDYEDASRLYGQAAALAPWNADYWYMQGQCEELLGNRKTAVRCLSKAVALDSTKSSYLARLGQVYFALGRYDSALSAFKAAAAIEEDNPSILFNIGLTLAKMDSVDRAVEAFEGAAKAHHVEKAAAVYRQLGALYYTHKKYRKAERQYASAVRLDPSDPEALFFYAICLDKKGDQKNASLAYRRFLAKARGDPSVPKEWIASTQKRLKMTGK